MTMKIFFHKAANMLSDAHVGLLLHLTTLAILAGAGGDGDGGDGYGDGDEIYCATHWSAKYCGVK